MEPSNKTPVDHDDPIIIRSIDRGWAVLTAAGARRIRCPGLMGKRVMWVGMVGEGSERCVREVFYGEERICGILSVDGMDRGLESLTWETS